MLDGRVIRGIDLTNQAFQNAFKKLPANVQREAAQILRQLVFAKLDELPRAWHMHPLTAKEVPSALDGGKKVKAWSLHITATDTYKASFTLEDGVAYFRTCGAHDTVDKKP